MCGEKNDSEKKEAAGIPSRERLLSLFGKHLLLLVRMLTVVVLVVVPFPWSLGQRAPVQKTPCRRSRLVHSSAHTSS